MSVEEIEEVQVRKLAGISLQRDSRFGTHETTRDLFGTYVIFWIGEEGLEKSQILKEVIFTKVAASPRVYFCSEHL